VGCMRPELREAHQEEMEALLERHVLSGLVDAPWVRTDDPWTRRVASKLMLFAANHVVARKKADRGLVDPQSTPLAQTYQ
jgi:hypothetical protein